jgi:hypothetical protein
MNRKIIYVDFIFKKKRITSKPLLFIYKTKISIKILFNKLFNTKSYSRNKNLNNSKLYPFKKVL